MKIRSLLFPVALLILTGCAPFTYQSEITFDPVSMTWKLPKDLDVKNGSIRVQVPVQIASNDWRMATFEGTNFSAKMNPQVLDKVTQHDVALINAVGAQVKEGIKAGIEAAK